MGKTNEQIEVKCKELVAKIKSIEKKDTYTQATSGKPNRYQVGKGGGDCSSTQQFVYKEVLGIDIGGNTVGQYVDSDLVDVAITIKNGIPDESDLQKGDLLYFAGKDSSRKQYAFVGHVEMYIGDNKLDGHGSGIGPFQKDLDDYCRMRYNSKTSTTLGHTGLVKVRRAKSLVKTESESKVAPTKVKTSCYPKCDKDETSLVDALTSIKVDSSKEFRTKIAKANGASEYSGSAEQNLSLLNLLKNGKLIKVK